MGRRFQLAPGDWGDGGKGIIVNFWLRRRSFLIFVERPLTKMRQDSSVGFPGAARTSARRLYVY